MMFGAGMSGCKDSWLLLRPIFPRQRGITTPLLMVLDPRRLRRHGAQIVGTA